MRRTAIVLFATWAILSVGALAYYFEGSLRAMTVESGETLTWMLAEREELLTYQLLGLNLPLSLVVAAVDPRSPILFWCLATLVGFVQWAVLAPLLVSWIRGKLRVSEPTA